MRLIHNLARNAAVAMDGGGELRITTRATEDDFYLECADTGPGIPPELEGRLFELFASGTQDGTGLGLAIAKKIIDEHNGDIRCESVPGKGATFTIRLPLDRQSGDSTQTDINIQRDSS